MRVPALPFPRRIRSFLAIPRLALVLAVAGAGLVHSAAPAAAAPGDLSTFVGGALGAGPATQVAQLPQSILGSGTLVFVGDANFAVIRVIDTSTGNEQVTAGDGTFSGAGDGGQAGSASIGNPAQNGVGIDGAGRVYLGAGSDSGPRVRRIDLDGVISTVAGNGTFTFSGDGGPATAAGLGNTGPLAVTQTGEFYIADNGSSRIRKVDSSGIISTVAGDGTQGFSGDGGPATSADIGTIGGLALDPSATHLYLSEPFNQRVRRVDLTSGTITTVAGNGTGGFAGDGGTATAAELYNPNGLTLDSTGSVYIADSGNSRIRKVNSGGTITSIAGTGIAAFSGDGGPATAAALNAPVSVGLGDAGSILIGDTGNARVRSINSSGVVSTLAGNGLQSSGGDGGPASQAQLGLPFGLAVDLSNNVYINDRNSNVVRKVNSFGIISTIAGTGIEGYTGDGGPATAAEISTNPNSLSVDSMGNLFISSQGGRVRMVNSAGIISTIAGNGTSGCTGDGGPATAAGLGTVRGVGVDSSGNLYLASWTCNTIRKVNLAGTITTIVGDGTGGFTGDGGPATAAELSLPGAPVFDVAGNMYIPDAGNGRVRKVATSGVITTIAGNGNYDHTGDGGPAIQAALKFASSIAIDNSMHVLYDVDEDDCTIRRISLDTSIISTIAGISGSCVFGRDGGPATTTSLSGPRSIALDSTGSLLFAENNADSQRIRRVAAPIPIPATRYVAADFDGDFRADVSVFRNSDGTWYDQPSSGGSYVATPYGTSGDIPVPGDYDGDTKTDQAIYRPSVGLWVMHRSSGGGNVFVTYGVPTDIPVPADYDGDGKTDIAVYRPSVGTWYIHRSSDGGDTIVTWGGIPGDIAVPADYDGDHKADIAIFRPSGGAWYVHGSGGTDIATAYGASGDIPVPADHDADLKADIGIFRPSTGLWAWRQSTDSSNQLVTYGGIAGDVPVVADYDQDGKADIAIQRPTYGAWYVHQTTNSADTVATFGIPTDTPLALPYAVRRVFYP